MPHSSRSRLHRHYHHYNLRAFLPRSGDVAGGGGGGVRCTPVCDQDHQFYQKFTSRAPTYVCNEHRVDWEIRSLFLFKATLLTHLVKCNNIFCRRFIPDCSPVYSAVHNRKCLEGKKSAKKSLLKYTTFFLTRQVGSLALAATSVWRAPPVCSASLETGSASSVLRARTPQSSAQGTASSAQGTTRQGG